MAKKSASILPVKKVKFSFNGKNSDEIEVKSFDVQVHTLESVEGGNFTLHVRQPEKIRGRYTRSNESKNAFPLLKPVKAVKMTDSEWLTQAGAADDRPESIQFIHTNWAADGFRLHKIEGGKDCACIFCKNKKKAENGKISWGDKDHPTSPQWEQLFPRSFKGEVKLNRDDIINACNVSKVFSREGSNVVRFDILDNSIIISAKSEETGNSKNEIVEGYSKTGINLVIAFNIDFVFEAVKAMSEKVTIKYNGSTQPAVFTDGNRTVLLMPMHLG